MQVAKRRRVELDLRNGFPSPGAPSYNQQDHAPQRYSRYLHSSSDNPVEHSDFGSLIINAQGASAALETDATSWDVTVPSYSDAYPDAGATFSQRQQQQPYFSGYAGQQSTSTDPSIYNSPWPPPQSQAEASFGSQSGGYGASTSGVMPFFGASSHAGVDFDGPVATSLQHYGHGIDMTANYSYAAPNGSVRAQSLAPDESRATAFDDASMQLKNQSLPILDHLAAQYIQTTAKLSLSQMQEIMAGSDTEEGQSYKTLKSLFEQTRKVYSRDTPFIDAIAIQMFQPDQQEVIRRANIATFISSILGAHDVSFFYLNEYFTETFVPLGHRLLKWQGAIFLDLKTQAYISALINSEGNPSPMLDELFPQDLDQQILTRHPDAPSLSPSEQDFIDRCRARKSYLLAEGNADSALKELPKKYQWTEFVREFAGCISKNVDAIMNTPLRTQHGASERHKTVPNENSKASATFDTAASLAGIREDIVNTPKKPTLSHSTSGASSTPARQPWTKPEEEALLSGLEQVNGPHWSQILALYGRGGSISEVLKDRNQVQLKDKARNLKLLHLKMGREVPNALRGVTGELKKRGGKSARAALEAEEADAEGTGDDGAVEDGGTTKEKASARGKTKKGS